MASSSSSSSSSSRILLLLLLALSIVVASSAAVSRPGARRRVPNVGSNEEVQGLGLFCVEEVNRRRGDGGKLLTFSRVAAAQSQVMSGIIYYLKIAAWDGCDRLFDAVVVVKPWLDSRRLVSFCPSSPLRSVSARR